MTETDRSMLATPHNDELDRRTARSRRGGERLCALTREVEAGRRADPLRGRPGRRGRAGLKRKLPGRGIWVTATRAALERGGRAQGLSPAASSARCASPPDLADADRAAARARRARCAGDRRQGRAGRGRLRQGRRRRSPRRAVVGLMHAAEAAADGVRKLAGRARGRPATSRAKSPVIEVFTAAQLDLALGRPNVVHAALLAGPASDSFLARCRRLERFRTGDRPRAAGMSAPVSPAGT